MDALLTGAGFVLFPSSSFFLRLGQHLRPLFSIAAALTRRTYLSTYQWGRSVTRRTNDFTVPYDERNGMKTFMNDGEFFFFFLHRWEAGGIQRAI